MTGYNAALITADNIFLKRAIFYQWTAFQKEELDLWMANIASNGTFAKVGKVKL